MKMRTRRIIVGLVTTALAVASSEALAQWPVVDVAAIRQLVQQVNAWQQQLRAMAQQLAQLQQTKAALTGPRGMEQLLRLTPAALNYLPPDWSALTTIQAGNWGAYADVGRSIDALVASNAILGPAELARLAGPVGDLLGADRTAVATGQTLMRLAYAHSSDRFATLSALIDRIGTATDAKAIADLQGRIASEQAMLANEGVKLLALTQAAVADTAARELARREAVVQNHGAFSARFQPVPPVP